MKKKHKVILNTAYNFMKYTCYIFLLTAVGLQLLVASPGNGQSLDKRKIRLRVEHEPLKSALSKIHVSTGLRFIYQDEIVEPYQDITIHMVDAPVSDILDKVLENTGLTYRHVKNSIVLVRKRPAAAAAPVTPTVQGSIKGKITDKQGVPVSGVTIRVKDRQTATESNAEGYYAIAATSGDILLFSFVGFREQEITVGSGTTIDIVLEEDLNELDQVVVVGMGTQRKASVIGAISTVSVDDIKIPTRSLTNALAGRMAGAVIVQRTGELGRDNGGFWIRGISTFSANRSPLILVDGVERDMQDLSVEEVESISILKDASATAVYGVRAANGVVLVTTRKGVAQKPVIDFKTEYGVSDLPSLPNFLGGADYARLYNEALGRTNYSAAYIDNLENNTDPYLYPNVNWYDETYTTYSRNAVSTLNVRGGGEVARYFVGFGYMNESGNLRNSPENEYKSNLGLQRYNFRSNVDVTLFKGTVVDLEVGGSLTDLHTPGIGSDIYGTTYSPAGELFYWSSLATPISNPVRIPIGKDKDGNDIMGWGAPTQVGEKNPVERLMSSGFNTDFRNQFMSQITLNQDLQSLVPGLQFKFSYSFDAYNTTSIMRRKASNTYGVQGRDPETGELRFVEVDRGSEFLGYSRSLGSNRAKETKAQLLYNTQLHKHRLGTMLMYYDRDYINGNAATAILSLPYRRQGVAFRATYDFDDRYFAEFNMGYNGSENFPKGQRFGFFPAVAAGWIVSNEQFMQKTMPAVSLLKLKGSLGLVGSEALPGGERYGYLSIYGAGLGGYTFGEIATAYTGTGENRIGVRDLTWEKGLKSNIGFELQLFNGAISLEADYFHETRTDILLQRASLPVMAGMNSAPFANMGKMVNRGVDGTLEVNKRFTDGGVRVYGNFTHARDKILEQDEADRNYPYRSRTGHKFGQNFGLIALGYFVDEEDIRNSPQHTFGDVRPGDVKYLDINGDGIVSIDDEVPIGYSNLPEINYGFGAQADFRNFDIGVFFRGQSRVSYLLGGSYIPFNQGVGKGNLFEQALDRWTVENPDQDALYPRLFNGTSANNWQSSTKRLYDGRFLRLADAEAGYTLQSNALSALRIKRLRIYALANNLALFAPWKLWDPETGTGNGGNYPLQRKINFGVRAIF